MLKQWIVRRIGYLFLLTASVLLMVMTAVHAQNSAPVLSNGQIGVVGARGVVLRHALTQQPLVQLPPGTLLTIKARSVDGQYLYAQTEDRQSGWVVADALLVVDVSGLPMMTLPAADSPLLTAAITGTLPITTVTAVNSTIPQIITLIPTASPAEVVNVPANAITALVTVQGSRLNLRSGPAVAYPVVGKADPGSRWVVIGRNATDDWVQLQPLNGGATGWAAAAYLQIAGALASVPVVTDLPPPPAPTARTLQPTPVPGNPAPAAASDAGLGAVGKTGLAGVLVFQDRIGGTIYLYDLGRDTLRPLTGGVDPALSPDGRRVAFTRDGGGNGLYVINVDGSEERVIYRDHPLLRAPKWSPDGRWIVFSRSNGYEDCRTVQGSVCLPDSAILEALPEELQGDIVVNKLVRDLPNQRAYHTVLARISPTGSDYRDIPSLDYAAAPDWNEGGIVYHSNAGIQRTADESDARSVQVANDALIGYFHDPAWQPGGGRIVFHRKQGSHWQIYAVNPDGSGLVALTRPVTALVDELPSNVSPTWSPDGRHILYVSNRNSIESAGAWHFWVMNADGSEQRLLPIDVILDYTFSSEQMVSWGPTVP
ncbi:MAG: SH3 domain-containing protein [Caldilineaceae bacterium]